MASNDGSVVSIQSHALALRQGGNGWCAQGPKLPFPSPRKRDLGKPPRPASDLSSPEKIRLSIEQNTALSVEAKRQQEQNAAEAGRLENADTRFALLQRQVLFVFEIALAILCLVGLGYFGATEPESAAALLTGGGSIASITSLLLRSRHEGNRA
jgi:hypothetical protein